MLEYWEKDEYLNAFKLAYEVNRPTSEEIYDVLKFLVTFSFGCRRLNCNELADRFDKRIELYYVGVNELGFRRGTHHYSVRSCLDNMMTRISNSLHKIVPEII